MNQLLIIAKTYTNEQDFVNSQEVKKIFEGWQDSITSRTRRTKFIAAYVVETNPEKNYGRAFDIYHHFEIADSKYKGMKRLMKVEVGSSLDNSGFQIADFKVPGEIFISGCFEKCDANRMKCIQHGWVIA